MANITRREPRELPARAIADPFRMMREMMRWDPFAELEALAPAGRAFVPTFEVKETKDAYVFKGDLPGLREEDVEISLTGNRLTVSGERNEEERSEEESFYAYERSYGSFTRSFTLPSGADLDHVQAEMKDGVLTVRVAKRPESQPKKISIAGTGAEARKGAKA